MVVQVMPRIARQNGDGSDQDHGKSMLEAPHRVDQRVRLDERRSIEVEVREEEGSKEAEELRMRRRHPIAGTEAIRGTRLLEETLETPVETFAGKLADHRIDEGQLSAKQDDGDIRAEEEDGREGDQGQQLGERVGRVVLDVGETERGIVARVDGARSLGHVRR